MIFTSIIQTWCYFQINRQNFIVFSQVEILYKELDENEYSDDFQKAFNKLDLNKQIDPPSLKNLDSRNLKVIKIDLKFYQLYWLFLCKWKVQDLEHKPLVTMNEINEFEAIVEMKGLYVLPDEISSSSPHKRHIFLYCGIDNFNFCINCQQIGNISRYVRSSDKPNAEVS